MDWQEIVPGAEERSGVDLSAAREIRLRPGQPVWAALPGGCWQGRHPLTPQEVTQAAQALSGHSLAAQQEALAQGFLALPGGHRLGVCGRMGRAGLLEITSLCLRLAHEVPGVGKAVFPAVRGKSALILGPPGSGKTTLLRDLIRLHGQAGEQVGLADVRGEIAACWRGMPQLDVGPRCDVVTGMEKDAALRLLIRSMAPDLVATDELGGPGDARAVLEALRCGVRVIATIHGAGRTDISRRQGMAQLLARGAFQVLIQLKKPGEAPCVLALSPGEG